MKGLDKIMPSDKDYHREYYSDNLKTLKIEKDTHSKIKSISAMTGIPMKEVTDMAINFYMRGGDKNG